MANEYAVNSADLAAVADAIRAKGGTEEPLAFPEEFVMAIENLSSGSVIGNRMWLFKDGDKCEDVTAGWMTSAVPYTSGGSANHLTVTYNADSVTLKQPTYNNFGIWRTIQPIDLTDFDYLEIESQHISGTDWSAVYVNQNVTSPLSSVAASKYVYSNSGNINTVSVQGLNGLFYVGIGVYAQSANTVKVFRISAVKLNT